MSDVNFVPKNLANGTSPGAKTAVYTVPVGKYALTRSIVLVNTSASAVTMNVYVSIGGGTSRRVLAKDISIPAGPSATTSFPIDLTLSGGDAIQMDSSSAGDVDFVVNGVESL